MARRQRKHAAEHEDDQSFEEEMADAPPSIDPYKVLGLETTATEDDVKKSYRKLALKHHPGPHLLSHIQIR